jgi:hypothetical protein
MDEALAEARSRLAQQNGRIDEDTLIGLAFQLAGGCPASIDGEADSKARNERKQTIAALISVVAEQGSKRGLTKLLQLASCGIESPAWGRQRILEQAMARMIAFVPCPPPLPGDVAAERKELADFPILRLRKGVLRAELPTEQELDDLAYFLVAVGQDGEEVGARREGASWLNHAPANARREELFQALATAKSAGNVLDVERRARTYLETLNFPDALHGAEEDVFFWHAPRYHHVMLDLAQSWETLGRFHEAAGLWRRLSRAGAACGTGADYAWQQQVKAVIRDEEIAGRCEPAVGERLLAVEEAYGPKRLADAGFDVVRLYRGALLTINRDAGEQVVSQAIAALPGTPRLFATMRIRDKGLEDWERRLQAGRGVADTMREAAIPLLVRAAAESLPPGRQRAIAALGDLAERPYVDPCGNTLAARSSSSSQWARPISHIMDVCKQGFGNADRRRLSSALLVYAKDRDLLTREAVAIALGKLAMPASEPSLRRMLRDGETAGTVCTMDPDEAHERCQPNYPVRTAAREALDNIAEVEQSWRKSRTAPSLLR